MSHWKSIAKIIKENTRRNKKRKENQIFNFIWVISQLVVKIEGVYFNYWSETLVIRKKRSANLTQLQECALQLSYVSQRY